MASKEFTVRIGREEIAYILDRKESLDHHRQLWEYISRYRALGWDLTLMTGQGADLGLDLNQPKDLCWQQLADLGLDGVQVNLAVRCGRDSRLLVLEVNNARGAQALDLLGDWRSLCVAELGGSREQHYYYLPPGTPAPASQLLARDVLIYGEGGLVLAPPSVEPDGRDPWRWRTAPWENLPQAPKPALWQFLREQAPDSVSQCEAMPAWEEIYPAIAPCDGLFKVLMAPAGDLDNYYRDILQAARALGLGSPQPLLGLLWHAPHGDARTNRERWQYLQNLVASAQLPAAGASALALTGEGAAAPEAAAAEPPTVAEAPASADQVGKMARQLLGEDAPARPKLEKTVSGQFSQLLATLGERVISEFCRSGPSPSGDNTRAMEMELLTAEIEDLYAAEVAPGGAAEAASPLNDSAASPESRQKNGKLQEVKMMVRNFLNHNPDLAENRSRVQMVLFCLQNYVGINPDSAGLPFGDKLEQAGQMARTFLNLSAEPH